MNRAQIDDPAAISQKSLIVIIFQIHDYRQLLILSTKLLKIKMSLFASVSMATGEVGSDPLPFQDRIQDN